MSLGGWDYLGVFVASLALTLVFTPLALRVALRIGALDHPGLIKAQSSPVPYLGGAAIVLAFAFVVGLASLVRPPYSGAEELLVMLGLAALLGIVGLLDDLRGLSPWIRLGVEIAAAVVVWATPAGPEVFGNDALNLVVTIVWIVGITNAVNFLDNMDGLSAGTVAIAAFFLFVIASEGGQFLVATLALGLCGCAIGFLRSNFPPARIYMGDAGSLFLGFMLAVLALKLDFLEAPRTVGLAVPVILLGVPIFDMTLVTVNRLIHKRSPLAGGRDHSSHRLVFVGIPVPAAVTLIYAGGISLGYLALVVSRVDKGTAFILLSWILLVALVVGVLLSQVPVYETSRRRHMMLQAVVPHEPELPVQGGDISAELLDLLDRTLDDQDGAA